MTLIKAIELAKEQGHIIEYKKRKDGGVRVTKVDGVQFSSKSSKGNSAVRSLTGGKLSVKQAKALKISGKRAKSKSVSKSITKEFRKLNKAREKVGLKKVKKADLLKSQRKKGAKESRQMLDRMEKAIKYKLNFAYTMNVAGFVSQLEDALHVPNKVDQTYNFYKVIDLIENNINYISENALESGIAILYLWLNGEIDGETAQNNMLVEFKLDIDRLKEVERTMLEE